MGQRPPTHLTATHSMQPVRSPLLPGKPTFRAPHHPSPHPLLSPQQMTVPLTVGYTLPPKCLPLTLPLRTVKYTDTFLPKSISMDQSRSVLSTQPLVILRNHHLHFLRVFPLQLGKIVMHQDFSLLHTQYQL